MDGLEGYTCEEELFLEAFDEVRITAEIGAQGFEVGDLVFDDLCDVADVYVFCGRTIAQASDVVDVGMCSGDLFECVGQIESLGVERAVVQGDRAVVFVGKGIAQKAV